MHMLLVCLPLLRFLLCGSFGRAFGVKGTPFVASLCIGTSEILFLLSLDRVQLYGNHCILCALVPLVSYKALSCFFLTLACMLHTLSFTFQNDAWSFGTNKGFTGVFMADEVAQSKTFRESWALSYVWSKAHFIEHSTMQGSFYDMPESFYM
jgi:hypothetical protein